MYQKLGGSLGGVVTEWDEHYGPKMLSILHYLFSSLTVYAVEDTIIVFDLDVYCES